MIGSSMLSALLSERAAPEEILLKEISRKRIWCGVPDDAGFATSRPLSRVPPPLQVSKALAPGVRILLISAWLPAWAEADVIPDL
jgi:hypothetical protein